MNKTPSSTNVEILSFGEDLGEVCYLASFDKVTNSSGTVVDSYSFDAWGNRRSVSDWTAAETGITHLFSRGFTGYEHLDEFGLINMNGRCYDPLLGRILSPDPLLQNPFDIQNFNRYSYCLNNPLMYIDPSGYLIDLDGPIYKFLKRFLQNGYSASSWTDGNDIQTGYDLSSVTITDSFLGGDDGFGWGGGSGGNSPIYGGQGTDVTTNITNNQNQSKETKSLPTQLSEDTDNATTFATQMEYAAREGGVIANNIANSGTLKVIGELTGVTTLYKNEEKFRKDHDWVSGIKVAGQLTVMIVGYATGIEEIELASIYLQNGNVTNYWNVMDSIPIKYQFGEIDMQSHQDFIDYFGIVDTLIANNMNYTQLSYTQIQKLYDLISRSSNYTAAYARAILLKADTTYTYNEPIILPDDNTRMMTKVSKPSIKTGGNLLKVYPNPAKDHFVVEYNVVNDLNNATIDVVDMLGHKMQSNKLTAKTGQITINTGSYAKSMYVCFLKNNGKIISKTLNPQAKN